MRVYFISKKNKSPFGEIIIMAKMAGNTQIKNNPAAKANMKADTVMK